MDFPLYIALFPTISVIPVGTSDDVVKAVTGLNGSFALHTVRAFGLVDRDNRCDHEVDKLMENEIYALDTYSVESLYYCSDATAAVSDWQAKALQQNAQAMRKEAREKALLSLKENGLAERMAARRCEKRVRDQLRSRLPVWEQIRDNPKWTMEIDTESEYQGELSRFQKLLDNGDIEEIIARYPIRETPVLTEIAKAFGLSRKNYEKTLVARTIDDTDLAEKLRQRLKPLYVSLMSDV